MLDPLQTLRWMQTRRSSRTFTDATIAPATIDRLLQAAVSAPSSSNRQPWRYVVIVTESIRQQIVAEVRAAADALEQLISSSPHAAEFGKYGDFFWQPLDAAAVIIIPCTRRLPDTLANLLTSAKHDPSMVQLPSAMPMEICATAAGVMALMLQAHAEGLGACWMAGPMIAATQIERIIGLTGGFHMLGAMALGMPDLAALELAKPERKPLAQSVRYL
jgi:nitroreductase